MAERFWHGWPTRDRASGDGYAYALEYSSGAVKIGSTRDPRTRMQHLEWNAAQYGVTVTRSWLSRRHGEYRDSEARAIARACSLGQRIGSETFRAPFDDVVAAVSSTGQYVPAPPGESVAETLRRDRRDRARAMSADGMTYRAIAGELGVSLGTVHAYCTA